MIETTPDLGGEPLVLRSDRLKVEVASPGTVYRGTRFDWTGFVTQVTLDESHTFCVPESLSPGEGTGGIGLCSEFGIERAVGYEGTVPGGTFPKLGIGLLVRPDDAPYQFTRAYEIAERFPVHVSAQRDMVTYQLDPLPCRGYAVRQTRVLSVRDNELTLAGKLENVGQQPIATHEYCHNFLGIDGHPMGPDYRLAFAQRVRFADLPVPPARYLPPPLRLLARTLPGALAWAMRRRMLGIFRVDGQSLQLRRMPERPFYARLSGLAPTARPQWRLAHVPSGVSVCECDDFAPSRLAIWGTVHVISAEVFVELNLRPGETQTWTRRYTFERE